MREIKKNFRPTQKQAILNLLKKRKSRGVTNAELSKIALCYQTRIFELNQDGYKIEVNYIGRGLTRYVLVGEGEPAPKETVYDKVIKAIKANGNSVDSKLLKKILKESDANVCRKSIVQL